MYTRKITIGSAHLMPLRMQTIRMRGATLSSSELPIGEYQSRLGEYLRTVPKVTNQNNIKPTKQKGGNRETMT